MIIHSELLLALCSKRLELLALGSKRLELALGSKRLMEDVTRPKNALRTL